MTPSRPVDWLTRVLLALAVGLPLLALWPASPLGRFLPAEIAPGVGAGWVLTALASVTALVASARAAGTLAWTMGLVSAALVALLYPFSRLDWSRLLKDWGLVAGALPWNVAVALSALALTAAWGLHVLALRRALVDRYLAKGAPPAEVARAGAGVTSAGARVGGVALTAVSVLALAHAGSGSVARVIGAWLSSASFLVPLLAAGAVAVVLGLLLARK